MSQSGLASCQAPLQQGALPRRMTDALRHELNEILTQTRHAAILEALDAWRADPKMPKEGIMALENMAAGSPKPQYFEWPDLNYPTNLSEVCTSILPSSKEHALAPAPPWGWPAGVSSSEPFNDNFMRPASGHAGAEMQWENWAWPSVDLLSGSPAADMMQSSRSHTSERTVTPKAPGTTAVAPQQHEQCQGVPGSELTNCTPARLSSRGPLAQSWGSQLPTPGTLPSTAPNNFPARALPEEVAHPSSYAGCASAALHNTEPSTVIQTGLFENEVSHPGVAEWVSAPEDGALTSWAAPRNHGGRASGSAVLAALEEFTPQRRQQLLSQLGERSSRGCPATSPYGAELCNPNYGTQ